MGAIRMKLKILGIASLLGLSACVSAPTQEQIANADYGSYPDNYEQIVKDHFSATLFDPYSVVYNSIRPPVKQMWGDRIDGARYDYNVCVNLNAKNRMGGYVGATTSAVMIHNGVVVQVIDGAQWFGRNLC